MSHKENKSLINKIIRVVNARPYYLWKYTTETIAFSLNYVLLKIQDKTRTNVIVGANPRVLSINLFRAEKPDAIIRVGDNAIIYGRSEVMATDKGQVTIGNNCVIGSNFRLYCKERVVLGNAVLISWNVLITDYDGHPIDPERRYQEILYMQNKIIPSFNKSKEMELDYLPEYRTKPVIVEDKVWIGANVMILKGVHIGAGSIVGAGSVVTNDVPSGCIVAGNPARVIQKLNIE